MPPALPLITLLTDFGTKDHFVASMKGVILSINSQARIIDITHEIAPFRIAEAASCLRACYRTFPEGTVHVAVVDPGVGSSRRPILVTTSRYFFVAPDNGVLTLVLAEEQDVEIRHLENRQYQLESPGATFHGRDLFAPAAAWLTKGQPSSVFGGLIDDPVRLPVESPAWCERTLVGQVTGIDRFGNFLTDITVRHLDDARAVTQGGTLTISIAGSRIDGLVSSYSEGRTDHPAALINSNGFLEVFMKEGSATDRIQIRIGEQIRVG